GGRRERGRLRRRDRGRLSERLGRQRRGAGVRLLRRRASARAARCDADGRLGGRFVRIFGGRRGGREQGRVRGRGGGRLPQWRGRQGRRTRLRLLRRQSGLGKRAAGAYRRARRGE